MSFKGFGEEANSFYAGLAADNSKAYWMANRHIYESPVREPMRELLDQLAPTFEATPVLFRPYRDVRFSPDKSPYKVQRGGFLEVAPGMGYHVQLDPDGVQLGAGFHARSRVQTARYRSSVEDPATGERLARILSRLGDYELGGDEVRTRPRGVAADHPRLGLMRREYVTVAKRIPTGAVKSAVVRKEWTRLRPLVGWIKDHVGAD